MPTYGELRGKADAAWAPFVEPQKTLIKVGVATCSRVVGAEETLSAIREQVKALGIDADVMMVGCIGLCYAEPLVEVRLPGQPPVLHQQVTADKVGALLDAVKSGSAAGPGAMAVLGAGNSDTVRAMLMPGEGVLSRKGMAALAQLNAGAVPSQDERMAAPKVTVNVINPGRSEAPQVSVRGTIKELMIDLIYRDPDVGGMMRGMA